MVGGLYVRFLQRFALIFLKSSDPHEQHGSPVMEPQGLKCRAGEKRVGSKSGLC